MNVTIDDVRKAGYCVRGARQWCKVNRIDFHALINGGVPADDLLATGDEIAATVIARKRDRER